MLEIEAIDGVNPWGAYCHVDRQSRAVKTCLAADAGA
jgi:hypothetical protein